MAITKIQSESLNLSDNYDFTGTVTGAGGVMTPAFCAERNGDQGISYSVRTTVKFNNEIFDSSNAYSTTSGTFTPQVAGKYYISANCQLTSSQNDILNYSFIELYKNSSVVTESVHNNLNNPGKIDNHTVIAIVDMNGSTDNVSIQAFINVAAGGYTAAIRDMSTFQAYKIIE